MKNTTYTIIWISIFIIGITIITKIESYKQPVKMKLIEKYVTSSETGCAYYTLRWQKPDGTNDVVTEMVKHSQNYQLGKTYLIDSYNFK